MHQPRNSSPLPPPPPPPPLPHLFPLPLPPPPPPPLFLPVSVSISPVISPSNSLVLDLSLSSTKVEVSMSPKSPSPPVNTHSFLPTSLASFHPLVTSLLPPLLASRPPSQQIEIKPSVSLSPSLPTPLTNPRWGRALRAAPQPHPVAPQDAVNNSRSPTTREMDRPVQTPPGMGFQRGSSEQAHHNATLQQQCDCQCHQKEPKL